MMFYVLFRIIFWIILCGLVILLLIIIFKRLKKRLRLYYLIIPVVISIAGLYISRFIPIENLFITFQSPEEAFNYTYIGKIHGIAEGNETALVLYSEFDNTPQTAIFLRSESGYKICLNSSQKRMNTSITNGNYGGSFSILQIANIQENYIIGTFFSSADNYNITDCCNSDFHFSVNKIPAENDQMIYLVNTCAFVEDFDIDNYYLFCGEEKVTFQTNVNSYKSSTSQIK